MNSESFKITHRVNGEFQVMEFGRDQDTGIWHVGAASGQDVDADLDSTLDDLSSMFPAAFEQAFQQSQSGPGAPIIPTNT